MSTERFLLPAGASLVGADDLANCCCLESFVENMVTSPTEAGLFTTANSYLFPWLTQMSPSGSTSRAVFPALSSCVTRCGCCFRVNKVSLPSPCWDDTWLSRLRIITFRSMFVGSLAEASFEEISSCDFLLMTPASSC